MTSFQDEIRQRIAEQRRQIADAERTGDDYLVEVLVGELESLSRLAAAHHVPLDPDPTSTRLDPEYEPQTVAEQAC